jgi:hypothetical protein
VLLDTLPQTSKFVDLRERRVFAVDHGIIEERREPPQLFVLVFPTAYTRPYVGEMEIEDASQFDSMLMIQRAVVHTPVEYDFRDRWGPEHVEYWAEGGFWERGDVDEESFRDGWMSSSQGDKGQLSALVSEL